MKRSFLGTIDRIEGDKAVIISSDDQGTIEISRSLLPDGSKEGDILSFVLNKKDKRTKDEKEKIKGMIEGLLNRKDR
jgi:hypothetical protein